MADSIKSYRDAPTTFEMGAAGRTGKRGIAGAVLGALAGAGAGAALSIELGPLVIGGIVVGGIIGAISGMKSSDPNKIQNRPIQINDTLFGGTKTVYISAEQWKDIKAKLAQGVNYDEIPDNLKAQFEASDPPNPQLPSSQAGNPS